METSDCPNELTKDKLDEFLEVVKDKISLFDVLVGEVKTERVNEGIKAMYIFAKKDIMMNAIPTEFKREFKSELRRAKDDEQLEKALKNILGETTKEEREARGRQEFNSLCRRIDRNEKFSVYLLRLKEEVIKVTEKVAAR